MRNNQAPSGYAIYSNALPFYLDRADLCTIDQGGINFAYSWVENLMQQNLSVQLNASDFAIEKLRHLYFESRNLERIKGAKTFGFGYPFLIDTYENELFVAPIFIWLLSIEPAQTKVDSWIIRFGEGQHILPNYSVLKFLKAKYGLDWKSKAEDLAFGKKLNNTSLRAFCGELADHLHFENHLPESGITTLPSLDGNGTYSQKGLIHWSGIISLFPPQYSSWQPGKSIPVDAFSSSEVPIDSEALVLNWHTASPQQMTVLETVRRNKVTIVESPDRTLLTNAIVNLLLNALSDGKKALVVSDRVPALKYTQSQLSDVGLSQLHFLLDDSLNDKLPLLELLRVAAEGSSRRVPHTELDYQFKKHKYQRAKSKLDEAFAAVRRNVIGNNSWTETVGLFLANQRVEGKELLSSQLNPQEFAFNEAEYEVIQDGVAKSIALFDKVKTLSHPLSNLHENIIREFAVEDSYRYVKENLGTYLKKIQLLHHRFILQSDTYASRLKESYEQYFNQFKLRTTSLTEKIADSTDSLGKGFQQAGVRAFDFSIIFSSKSKKIRNAQLEAAQDYCALVESYMARPYFDFTFQPCKEGENIPKTTENLKAFTEALHRWHDRIDIAIQEEIGRLNSKTVHHELEFKESINELEHALDALLEELNESALYQKSFENKTLTLPQRQKYLESIVEQLENTQLNLRDFGPFYQWQHQWLDLTILGQKVVRALVKVKPNDWKAALDSWYFYNLLSKEFNPGLPNDGAIIQDYEEVWFALKPLIINQIIDRWQNLQLEKLRALKRESKKSYKLIFEKQGHQEARKMPLSEVMGQAHEAICSLLPVMFVTPQVALDSIPSKAGFYDLIIYDEANCFSLDTAVGIAPLCKKMVICGTSESYEKEANLLQYAIENEAPMVRLHKQEGVLQPKSNLEDYGELEVKNVEGRYDELDDTNDVEAQHIVRLLNQIKQSPQRIYPSVGIVTFTKAQRDLISTYLLKLKQQNSAGSEKILQFERNGMGVFCLEELYGQQFEVLIVSGTFGQVDISGNVTKKVTLLDSPEMISSINLLINQQVKQIYLIHSIPDYSLDKFLLRETEKGTWLLANYIRFIEALKNGNEEVISRFMNLTGRLHEKSKPVSLFAEEIAISLHHYFEEKRLVRNRKIEGLILPLVVKHFEKIESFTTIHPDGFFGTSAYTCGLWESERQKMLKEAGVNYIPVWSANWLKNAFNESRILASRIIKLDATFAKHEKNIEQENSLTDAD